LQNVPEISVSTLKARLEKGEQVFLLDVREPSEHAIVNLQGKLIPLGELPERLQELDKSNGIVVYCHHGNRSRYAAQLLLSHGFRDVKNLTGGIEAWATEIDPTMPHY
jgi:sulfur-carrier protein adenylyltransferase/sulfurtransferase